MNTSMTSADSGTVPGFGSSTRLAAGRSTGRFGRPPRVPREELRQRLAARHAWLQPPDDLEANGVFRPAWTRRNWPMSESGAQKSGGATASPRNPSGITPTI